MRSPRSRTPPVRHVDGFSLRIKEPARNEAMSLSVALKRPDRSFAGTTDSKTSSFTVRSARVYISVVCILECPSQSETFGDLWWLARSSSQKCDVIHAAKRVSPAETDNALPLHR